MPIGASKVGALGGLVPGGSVTFNASGTWDVPPGVKVVSITGKGGTGNPGNAGNQGNPGNIGIGAPGGMGGRGGNEPSINPGSPNASWGPAGGVGYAVKSTGPLRTRVGNQTSFQDATCLPSPQNPSPAPIATVTGQNFVGGCVNYSPFPGPARAIGFCGPAGVAYTPVSGPQGPAGNAGTAGNAGQPGNPGCSSSALGNAFPGGAGGNAGVGGAAGNGGSGGQGGAAGQGRPVLQPANTVPPGTVAQGGAGGNGGGSGGQGLSRDQNTSPTVGPGLIPCFAQWIKYGGYGGGGAAINSGNSGGAGQLKSPINAHSPVNVCVPIGTGGTDPGEAFPPTTQYVGGIVAPLIRPTCGVNTPPTFGRTTIPTPQGSLTNSTMGGAGGYGIQGTSGLGFMNGLPAVSFNTRFVPRPTPSGSPCWGVGRGRMNATPNCTPTLLNVGGNLNSVTNPLSVNSNNIFRAGGGGGAGSSRFSTGCGNPLPPQLPFSQSMGGGGGGGRGNAGNAGGPTPTPSGVAATPVTFNCVPVTPGTPTPITVASPGGQVVISWNPQ